MCVRIFTNGRAAEMMKEKIRFAWGWIVGWAHTIIGHKVYETVELGKTNFIACRDCQKFLYRSDSHKGMTLDDFNEFIRRREQ